MEVKQTQVSKSKIASTLDLSEELAGLNKSQRNEVLDQIGELIIEQILSTVAEEKSPVDGSSFQMLSKDYAKKKKEETGSSSANLDLTGSMLNALDFKVKNDAIEIGVYGKEDAGKADGHNNFSGASKLPTRQFLPKENQSFDDPIKKLIQEHIDTYKADNIELDSKELKQVETKADLYSYLKDEFDGMSDGEIKDLILRTDLAATLDKYDLLDLL